jgi:hypothetical protein
MTDSELRRRPLAYCIPLAMIFRPGLGDQQRASIQAPDQADTYRRVEAFERLIMRVFTRIRRSGSRWVRTARPMAPTRSMTVSAWVSWPPSVVVTVIWASMTRTRRVPMVDSQDRRGSG